MNIILVFQDTEYILSAVLFRRKIYGFNICRYTFRQRTQTRQTLCLFFGIHRVHIRSNDRQQCDNNHLPDNAAMQRYAGDAFHQFFRYRRYAFPDTFCHSGNQDRDEKIRRHSLFYRLLRFSGNGGGTVFRRIPEVRGDNRLYRILRPAQFVHGNVVSAAGCISAQRRTGQLFRNNALHLYDHYGGIILPDRQAYGRQAFNAADAVNRCRYGSAAAGQMVLHCAFSG